MRGMAAPLAARRVTEYQTEVTYVDFEVTLDSGGRVCQNQGQNQGQGLEEVMKHDTKRGRTNMAP
ncbi:unnamed protein product [Fusarium graminearum]|nr:unnamed protein product [Fusarium graminearum]CAF3594318.1 unnamed protein product [Fusarium graminearum]CAF3597888.1 unnamed protein product [Fusarium graminearum]CAG1963651.1 unnamed protein product [Fusarium graminearum]CAG1982600.1 unnamed protein product [Fusarium graminearum]